MQVIDNKASLARRLIILLGSQGAGKTRMLLSLLGRTGRISICSKQNLLQSHLTPRENLQLMASLVGLSGQERVDELLLTSALGDIADQERVYTLPRPSRRMLGLLIALLPNPNTLLIDDLTAGLSLQAKRGIWQFILAEQKRRPRTILYATSDLEAARFLGDEIWLLEDGQVRRKWPADEIPDALRASASFAIELKSIKTAQRFRADVEKLDCVINVRFRGDRVVEALVNEGDDIVTLTWMAGYDLVGFRSLPLEVDQLPDGWYQNGTWKQESNESHEEIDSALQEIDLSLLQMSTAIWQIALSEWRRHFRSFWKAGNLLLTGIWILTALGLIFPLFDNLEHFLRWGSLLLLLSSTMTLGLGLESISRLTTVGEMDTLFQPAQPSSKIRPLSPMVLFDLTHIGRRGLLVGISFGQFLVLMAHAWPLLFYAYAVSISFSLPPVFWAASVIFWLLTASTSLALTVLLSGMIHRPGWGLWLGWLIWLLAVASSQLPSSWAPVVWLWPFAGYSAAFGKLLHPEQILQPLGFALLGTLLTWFFAGRAFCSRSAIWLES